MAREPGRICLSVGGAPSYSAWCMNWTVQSNVFTKPRIHLFLNLEGFSTCPWNRKGLCGLGHWKPSVLSQGLLRHARPTLLHKTKAELWSKHFRKKITKSTISIHWAGTDILDNGCNFPDGIWAGDRALGGCYDFQGLDRNFLVRVKGHITLSLCLKHKQLYC